MAEPTAASTTAAAPVQKAKWEFADGKVYEAENPEQLLEMVGKRYNDLYPEFQRIKDENSTLKQQATTGIEAAPEAEDKFSDKKYFELLSTAPLEAARYATSFIPEYQSAVSDLKQMRQVQEANAFRAMHPEFKQDAAEVDKLAQTCRSLYPNQETVSAQQMSAAYALIHFKPQESTVSQPTNPNPPIPPNQSASVAAPTKPVADMTQQELAAYIRQLEGQR